MAGQKVDAAKPKAELLAVLFALDPDDGAAQFVNGGGIERNLARGSVRGDGAGERGNGGELHELAGERIADGDKAAEHESTVLDRGAGNRRNLDADGVRVAHGLALALGAAVAHEQRNAGGGGGGGVEAERGIVGAPVLRVGAVVDRAPEICLPAVGDIVFVGIGEHRVGGRGVAAVGGSGRDERRGVAELGAERGPVGGAVLKGGESVRVGGKRLGETVGDGARAAAELVQVGEGWLVAGGGGILDVGLHDDGSGEEPAVALHERILVGGNDVGDEHHPVLPAVGGRIDRPLGEEALVAEPAVVRAAGGPGVVVLEILEPDLGHRGGLRGGERVGVRVAGGAVAALVKRDGELRERLLSAETGHLVGEILGLPQVAETVLVKVAERLGVTVPPVRQIGPGREVVEVVGSLLRGGEERSISAGVDDPQVGGVGDAVLGGGRIPAEREHSIRQHRGHVDGALGGEAVGAGVGDAPGGVLEVELRGRVGAGGTAGGIGREIDAHGGLDLDLECRGGCRAILVRGDDRDGVGALVIPRVGL